MDRTQIAQLQQPIQAECYYVQDEDFHWAFITITPAIGLVQVHSDSGAFSHRYEVGGDFREYLLKAEGIRDKFDGWWHGWNRQASEHSSGMMRRNLKTIMTHLWPLFIEKLKARVEAEKVTT